MMFKCIFFMIFYTILLLYTNEGGKITDFFFVNSTNDQSVKNSPKTSEDGEFVWLDSSSDQLEEDLNEAINDDDEHRVLDLSDSQLDKSFEQELLDMTDGSLEEELERASKDDAYVPRSLDNSPSVASLTDDFEQLSLSDNDDQQINYFSLEKVLPGHLPPGIIKQSYSFSNQIKLIQLYESHLIEDVKELFEFIAQHIHNKYTNCASNLGQWLRNPQIDEPIFYRNCVPCTNAVDLNLQSLFNNYIHIDKLEHYFVNTCQMQKQWISYVSQMEYLDVDLNRHPTTTFTDVIRRNLLPNHRYVFQGIVKSNRGNSHKGFNHVCNLINDEYGHIWIIDGQIQRVFDFNQDNDLKELDQRYRPDYIARAYTGLFRPPAFIHNLTQTYNYN
ncbi:unnamed protein product [Adineta steineri]|uniref:Uncharacterized protein n=1 Tax=Adineta steineri TaxID=433720 RepID=A0A814RIS0_9BILA|nr:unnamed protein product [Adineta steineri]CAF1133488.1 unnamed protein product [Adineta steineri]